MIFAKTIISSATFSNNFKIGFKWIQNKNITVLLGLKLWKNGCVFVPLFWNNNSGWDYMDRNNSSVPTLSVLKGSWSSSQPKVENMKIAILVIFVVFASISAETDINFEEQKQLPSINRSLGYGKPDNGLEFIANVLIFTFIGIVSNFKNHFLFISETILFLSLFSWLECLQFLLYM